MYRGSQPASTSPDISDDPLRGLDANLDLTTHVECLAQQGFRFAMRYYTVDDHEKTLTWAEAQALVKAGFQLGAIFEDGFPTHRSFFNHAKGVLHGKSAAGRARNQIGQPGDTAIYFAVDFDPAPDDLSTVIREYFEGIRVGLLEANNGAPGYQVGVYGSGFTCSELLKNELVTFTWLAQSTGFRGSKDFASQKRYNLIQFLDRDVCVINLGPDETNPAKPSGLFTVPAV